MATVYLARDIRHNRRVAIKLLDPEQGAVLGVERFLAEIQVTDGTLLLLQAAEQPQIMIGHNWADEARLRLRTGAGQRR